MIRAEQTHLRIPSRPDWVGPTAAFLHDKAILCGACSAERGDRLRAALHEALSNAIVHGNLEVSSELREHGEDAFARALAARAADGRYAGRFLDIEVVYNGQRCDWVLTQEGPGFDAAQAVARPNSSPACRGLLLMRAFVDEVRYACHGRQLVLSVRKKGCPEKRRGERRAVHAPVRVAPVRGDGSADWQAARGAVARNLSAAGIGLLLARPAASERVLLGVGDAEEMLYVQAEVRHCRKLDDNEVEVGCRFRPAAADPGTPPAPDVQAGVSALEEQLSRPRAVAEDRRAHPRFVYTERIAIRGESSRGPRAGYARDLSRGGISFVTTAPLLPEGCVLELPAAGDHPLRVRARVLRCDPILEGFYDAAAHIMSLTE
jgi:anti-sigma regulatory factor (Ser/Thr protein kinase)